MTRDEVRQVMDAYYIRNEENNNQLITSIGLRTTLEKILDYIDDCCQGGGGGGGSTVQQPYISSTPKISVTLTNSTYYEVGTTGITPSCKVTLTDGKYSCAGQTTNAGVMMSAVTFSSSEGPEPLSYSNPAGFITHTATAEPIAITDSTNYSVTATASTTDGNAAKNSTGGTTNIKITATTISGVSTTSIKGFRKLYGGGYSGTIDINDIDRTFLEEFMSYSANTKTVPNPFRISVPAGAQSFIVAIPFSGSTYNRSIVDVKGDQEGPCDVNMFRAYSKNIEGANSYTACNYKVYVYTPNTPWGTGDTYQITLG